MAALFIISAYVTPIHRVPIDFLFIYLNLVSAEYRHQIQPFSFNIQKNEYPLEYDKIGTCVALRDTIKLIPKVQKRMGGLYLSQPVETSSFEMAYKIDVKNDKNTIYNKVDGKVVDDIEGFALWYLHAKPSYIDYRLTFGYKQDFNGVGVFVFKH